MWRATWAAVCLCLAMTVGAADGAPGALAEWRDWVLHDHEWIACTRMQGYGGEDESTRICAWPGELRVDADARGARFSQRWNSPISTLVPLPGDRLMRPLRVAIDGRAAPVVMRGDRPWLVVQAGQSEVSGEFAWQRRPESLPVPDESGLLSLRLDGAEVAVISRRDGQLWLGRSETRVAADALSLRVYRLLRDGVPLWLSSDLVFEVAGRAREIELKRVLPEGFAALSVDSALPAQLAADGSIKVQLRPGSWRLRIEARSTGLPDHFAAVSGQSEHWPQEEVWSFAADPSLRVVQPVAESPVDPAQVGAPFGNELPSFVLAGAAALQLEQRSRGADSERPHRLHLQRDLWLDFDGDGFTARDQIHGELAGSTRLDLQLPWRLQQAQAGDQDLLVTAGDNADSIGVELRDRQLQLQTTARREDRGAGSVTGWRQDFESVALNLHLPPGWRLLAARGSDSAPGAWLRGWNLLDLFLVSLSLLLAHRLLGRLAAVLFAGYLLLGYQEPDSPLWSLLAVLAVGLLVSLLPAGRLSRVLLGLRRILLVVALLLALPFMARQLALAHYPQLERDSVGSAADYGYLVSSSMPAEAPAPAPMVAQEAAESVAFDRVEVAGSRVAAKAAAPQAPPVPPMRRDAYPKDAIVQAGPGLPDWSWQRESLGWDGPVVQAQMLDLWLLPPWATRLARVLMVLLLGWMLLRLAVSEFPARWPRRLIALVGALVLVAPVQASDWPSPELLDEYRGRLLQAPDCAPECASLARVEVVLDDSGLRIALDWHAAEEVAAPLPDGGESWRPATLSLNAAAEALRQQNGERWLRLPRGVHRAELRAAVAGSESLSLRFPMLPAEISVRADGWDVVGLAEGRLLGDSLQLLRRAGTTPQGGPATRSEFAPYVAVTRILVFDLEWTVETYVRRIAPTQSGFAVKIDLLPGEQLQDALLQARDGQVEVAFAAGEDILHWRSRLPLGEPLAMLAADLGRYSERWQLRAGPFWSLRLAGVPELATDQGDDWRRYQPLPGETLSIEPRRPQAVAGATTAIDRVQLTATVGQRAADYQLDADLRSTRGGQHAIQLPANAVLLDASLRGESQSFRLEQGKLSLPLVPGDNPLSLHFRIDDQRGLRYVLPVIQLGAPAANLRTTVHPGDDRWLLLSGGAGAGPAVLYWPQFTLMALLAFALGRTSLTPLRARHWFLLGLGFSTVSWGLGGAVVAWLFALGWRQRRPPDPAARWRFKFTQLGLLALSLLALACVVAAIPYGLLGAPDMQVAGNGSSAGNLNWFVDRSDGDIPAVWTWALPLWVYKLAILAWALWLANALIGWLRWAWQCYSTGGYWPQKPAVVAEPTPLAPVPDAAAAATEDGD